jgi:nuclear pore complex protein Nup98-Nup96
MFNQNNTPFGGGGFGQQNTTPAFGSPPAAPSGGLFGNQQAAAPAFGGQAQAPAFGGSAFGQAQAPTPFGGAPAPLFGSPAPAPTAFGAPAGGGMFGAPAAAPTSSIFGAPAPGAFGAPAPAAPMFGQQAPGGNTMFGSAAPAPANAFGAPTNAFGAAPAAQTAFGAPAGGTMFGAPAAAPSTGLFGAPAPAAFGAPAPGAFGSPAPAPTGMFGAPAPAPFGQAPAPATGFFGAPAPAPTPGMYGSPAGVAPGGVGTRAAPYQQTSKQDGTSTIIFQSITAMPAYEQKSFEELRMEDYQQGNRGSTNTTPTASNNAGGFGFSSAPAPTGGLFGSAPAPTGGLFGGSAPAPAPFGAPAPVGGALFGGAPAPAFGGGGFAAAPSAFGAAPAAFGSSAPAPGAFGAPTAFGGAPAPAAFGAPAPSTGLFGSAPAPAFGAPAAGGIFGAPTPASGGLFGAAPAPPLFGGAAPTPGFGAPAPSMFGQQPAPSAAGFFGGQAPAQAPFGAPPAAPGNFAFAPQGQAGPPAGYMGGAAPILPPNAQVIPPAMNEVFAQKMRTLQKLQDSFEKNRAWQPDVNTGSNTTPTSLSARDAQFFASPPYSASRASNMLGASSSPPSTARLRPRGFPKSNDKSAKKSAALLSDVGRGGSISTLSLMRSPVMQLVVKPNSVSRPRLRLKMDDFSETLTSPPYENGDRAGPLGGASLSPLAANKTSTPTAATSPAMRGTPKPSPSAEALYQAAISDQAPQAPYTPAAKGSAGSSFSPKLTMDGYETRPSIADLSKMSEAELAAVPNFVIARPGYGEVAWEGTVDVRDADLDRIISINPKDVAVYQIEEDEGTKPPVGTRLNRPAVITFFEVFPKDNAKATSTELEKFASRLEKQCSKMGAVFLAYERANGTWKIRVAHFSRYALIDDDSEDEAMPDPQPKVRFLEATPQVKSILRRKQTPYAKQSRIRFDLSMEESENTDEEDVFMTDAKILESVQANVAEAYQEVYAFINRPMSPTALDEVESQEKDIASNKVEEDISEDWCLASEIVIPDNDGIAEAMQMAGICSARLQSKPQLASSSMDAGLRHGKASRIGWYPDGRFLATTGDINGSLEELRPNFVEAGTSTTMGLLRLMFSTCIRNNGIGECPLLQFPASLHSGGSSQSHASLLDCLRTFSSTSVGNEEVEKTFGLLAALLEAPLVSSSMILRGDEHKESYSFDERRNQAFLKWLVDANTASVDENVKEALRVHDKALAVFSALSGGDIHLAAKTASDAKEVDLALVLASGAAGQSEIVNMLGRQRKAGMNKIISQDTLRSFRALAGEGALEEKLFREGSSQLDWRKRFALKLLRGPTDDLQSLVSSYDEDVSRGTAPFPYAQYPGASEKKAESVQYRVLRSIASPTTLSLAQVVDTRGFTAMPHGFALSFHLAVTLAASGYVDADGFAFEKILSGYEAELLNEGHWEWAVVVALSSTGKVSKTAGESKMKRAKQYILKFYSQDNNSETRRTFLEAQVGVPSAWFSEASAYRSTTAIEFVGHIWDVAPAEAQATLEREWLPSVYFMKKPDLDVLMVAIEAMADEAPDSLPVAVYRLQKLETRLEEIGGAYDQQVAEEALPALTLECNFIEKTLTDYLDEETRYAAPLRFPMGCRVNVKSMLHEALEHVRKLSTQLTSLSRSSQSMSSDLVA